jgi:hypothetical protein
VFEDAIVGSPEFINGLTADELYALELKRFEDWYAIVTAPSEIIEEQTEEE